MKLKISAVLIKEGVELSDAITTELGLTRKDFSIENRKVSLFWRKSDSLPKWIELFKTVEGVSTDDFRTQNAQAILAMHIDTRLICLTFGHARHLIDSLKIERYFGLKVALNIADPELLKSIDKSSIDKVPFQSRSQSSKYVSISEFEFKFDWEILKSITGVVENSDDDDLHEIVTGADSLSLFTDIDLRQLPALAERLLNAYHSDEYKKRYPWIDYIVPIRDASLISRLDGELINKINSGTFDSIWLSPPNVIDYANFSGYCYNRRHHKTSTVVTHPDIDLSQCLREKGVYADANINYIKSTKVYVYDASYQELEEWPLYGCLNAEIADAGISYLLSEGCWYSIDTAFSEQIEKYFLSIPRSSTVLPGYRGRQEGPYLESIADGVHLFLLDRKLIRPDGAGSSIEFCDLLTAAGDFIHVKKYSSSSVLSHLFSQAYVSAECLLKDDGVVAQVNSHLAKVTTHTLSFDKNLMPRANRIILAIMDKRRGDINMPFFSKVNLKQYSQRLTAMGFKVELLKIPY